MHKYPNYIPVQDRYYFNTLEDLEQACRQNVDIFYKGNSAFFYKQSLNKELKRFLRSSGEADIYDLKGLHPNNYLKAGKLIPNALYCLASEYPKQQMLLPPRLSSLNKL